jgi:hypothetical protein
MSLTTQIYRSLSALPLLLVALLALLQGPESRQEPPDDESVATGQLLLPLLAAPGTCPASRVATRQDHVVVQLSAGRAEVTISRCRV